MGFLLKNENVFNGQAEVFGDFMCQQNGWVVPSIFQRTDGLAGDTHRFCKFLLPDSPFFPDGFDSVFQGIPPDKCDVKFALQLDHKTSERECQVNFT